MTKKLPYFLILLFALSIQTLHAQELPYEYAQEIKSEDQSFQDIPENVVEIPSAGARVPRVSKPEIDKDWMINGKYGVIQFLN